MIKVKRAVITAIVFLLLLTSNALAAENRFHEIFSNEEGQYYIDTQTYREFQDNTTKDYVYDVWVKKVENGFGYVKDLDRFIKTGVNISAFKDLKEILLHYHIKSYPQKEMKLVGYACYDYKGNTIVSETIPVSSQRWIPVVPASMGETLVDKIQNYAFQRLVKQYLPAKSQNIPVL